MTELWFRSVFAICVTFVLATEHYEHLLNSPREFVDTSAYIDNDSGYISCLLVIVNIHSLFKFDYACTGIRNNYIGNASSECIN